MEDKFKISQTDGVIQTLWRKSSDCPTRQLAGEWLGHFDGWRALASLISPRYLIRWAQKTGNYIHEQAENAVFIRQNCIFESVK